MSKLRRKPYVLVAGGTGGHLFPALSLAATLSQFGKPIILFTDERAESWIDSKHLERVWICRFGPNRGKRKVSFLLRLIGCGLKSLFLFIKDRPEVVVGFGSYVSAPALLAAQILGIPTILHEQNNILGRANRILAKRARCIATAMKEIRGLGPKVPHVFVGNPVRPHIAQLYTEAYKAPSPSDSFHILIIGGSQGSEILSQILPEAITRLKPEECKRIKVCQQVVEKQWKKVGLLYKKTHIEANLAPFFSNMPALLQWAHVVIGRSGASSLSEYATAGLPSLLIPFAKSLDGDQLYNARYFEQEGAAKVLLEEDFTIEHIQAILREWMNAPETLEQMSASAKRLATPDASQRLAEIIEHNVS